MMEIKYRRATAEDASFVALVVKLALGEESLERYCGENGEEIIAEIARSERTQYSYQNTIIAEVDGSAVGAAIGYDGDKLHELRQRTLAVIERMRGFRPAIENETEGNEFYLDSIAVLPEWQGRGIGACLIEAMRNAAFDQGFQRVGLLVDMINPDAERLYQRLGFCRVNTTTLLGHSLWHLQVTRETASRV